MVTIMVTNVDEAPEHTGEDPEEYAENGTRPVETYRRSTLRGGNYMVAGR